VKFVQRIGLEKAETTDLFATEKHNQSATQNDIIFLLLYANFTAMMS
jgi:hypothetical protein